MKTIALCGGGTAGHVMPAMALLPLLKKHYDRIVYIGEKGGIEEGISSRYGLEFYGITCCKLRRSMSLKNALIPFRLLKGIGEARVLLKKINPSAVFSKGGYASLPVVTAASLLKIPVIAHESDMSPGLSNKISANMCRVVCTSFKDCAQKLKNGVYTGSPLREELFNGDKKTILKNLPANGKPVLLFIGGSSGARFLNDILSKCAENLIKDFNIIHITGKGNKSDIKLKGYVQTEFAHNIADIYAASDYIVSRAGSNAVFELLALKKSVLLIPLPKDASRGDQIENAEFFSKKGCAITVEQSSLTPMLLTEKINLLKQKKSELTDNISKNGIMCGNENIVKQILKYSL